jgi:hypothetical protein
MSDCRINVAFIVSRNSLARSIELAYVSIEYVPYRFVFQATRTKAFSRYRILYHILEPILTRSDIQFEDCYEIYG